MAHHRQKLRFGLVRLLGRLLGTDNFLFVGNIPEYHNCTFALSFVKQRCCLIFSKKTRPVFAPQHRIHAPLGLSGLNNPEQGRSLRPVMNSVRRRLPDMVQIGAAHDFVLLKTQHMCTSRIDERDPSLGIQSEYAFRHRIQNQRVFIAQLLDLLGIPDALCDVAGNPIHPYYLLVYDDWNVKGIDFDQMAIFMDQGQIIALRFSLAGQFEMMQGLLNVLLMHNGSKIHADQLIKSIPCQFLQIGIGRQIIPVQIHGVDRRRIILEKGLVALLAFSKLLLHLTPLGNILHHADKLHRLAARAARDIPLNMYRKQRSVRKNQPVGGFTGLPLFHNPLNTRFQQLQIVRMNQR
ncbi:hypothetical protein D3C73_753390 [compost metagenome]